MHALVINRDVVLHRLADGGSVAIDKIGRKYLACRTRPPFDAPPDSTGLVSLAEARAFVADVLRRDVLELDD
jgi:hypothetical protein